MKHEIECFITRVILKDVMLLFYFSSQYHFPPWHFSDQRRKRSQRNGRNNIGYIVCIHIITQSDFALFDREVAMLYFSGKQFGITITIFIEEKYEKI